VNQFDTFVAVDWSGKRGSWLKGIRIAETKPGNGAPSLVSGPGRRGEWSRIEVVRWLVERTKIARCLIGLDFAFGFPTKALKRRGFGNRLNWSYVETLCQDEPELYGGPFYLRDDLCHSQYINGPRRKNGPNRTGVHYCSDLLRDTEREAARLNGARPQSVLNFVGPAQVGPGSVSGMRALLMLRRDASDQIAIWPFDSIGKGKSVVVEIFPRYLALKVASSGRLSIPEFFAEAIKGYEAEMPDRLPNSEDEADALLSAVALRVLSQSKSSFDLAIDSRTRITEGWIFGVSTT
jgi:hypothetical protein